MKIQKIVANAGRIFRRSYGQITRKTDRVRFSWELAIRITRPGHTPYFFAVNDPLDPTTQITHAYASRKNYLLEGAVANPLTGSITLHGVGIAESTPWNPEKRMLKSLVPCRTRELKGIGATVFVAELRWNYYHFLIEDLPMVIRARRVFGAKIVLIGADAPPFVWDFIELLGLKALAVAGPIKLELLALPTRGNDTGWPHKEDLTMLRDEFVVEGGLQSGLKVYVSRRRSSRSVPDENVLELLLSKSGFSTVFPEDMTAELQVELFRGVSELVAPHGAGLANMVFMPAGGSVVEIAEKFNANPCFEIMAKQLGLYYKRVFVSDSGSLSSEILEDLRPY